MPSITYTHLQSHDLNTFINLRVYEIYHNIQLFLFVRYINRILSFTLLGCKSFKDIPCLIDQLLMFTSSNTISSCIQASKHNYCSVLSHLMGCTEVEVFLDKRVRETRQTAGANLHRGATKKREISWTLLSINLHFSVQIGK